MKTCPYCGTKYPDEATVCASDGQKLKGLESAAEDRSTVAGVWRGAYGYGEISDLAGLKAVAFTLRLEQDWLGHFTGTVTEDAPEGTPGTGVIDGYFGMPTIEFTKQMPVGYFCPADGNLTTMRKFSIARGQACEHEFAGPLIRYQGTFLDANRVQGIWIIESQRIASPDGKAITTGRSSGFWCAEFFTTNLHASPTGGPKEPLFDKARLPPSELDGSMTATFPSLGKFDVMEAGTLTNKFEAAGLRFAIIRDDSPIRQMSPLAEITGGLSGTAQMIELFVHPEDEAKALEALGLNHQV